MLKSQKMAVRGRTKESQGSKSTFKLRQLHGSLQRLATDQQRKQKYLEEMKQDIKGKTELLETMKTNLTTLMTLQQSIISKHDDDSKFIRKTQTELDNAEQRVLTDLHPLFNSMEYIKEKAWRTAECVRCMRFLFRNAKNSIPCDLGVSKMEKQIAEVQKAESKLSKTKDGLMEEINKLQGHLLDSGTKQTDLHKRLTESQRKHMNSEKTLRKTQGLLEEAEDALADQKKRKKEIECRLKEIQESMQVESHTFDEEVDELMKKNEELTSQIEAIYNESQNLESLVKEKTQKYLDEGKLKQNLAAYRQSYVDAKNQKGQCFQELSNKLTKTTECTNATAKELEHLKKAAITELQKHKEQIMQQKQLIGVYGERLSMHQEEILASEEELGNRGARLGNLNAKIKTHRQALKDRKKMSKALSKILGEFNASSSKHLKQLLATEKAKRTKLQKEKTALMKKVEKNRQIVSNFEEERTTVESLQKSVLETDESISMASKEISEEELEAASLKKQEAFLNRELNSDESVAATEVEELQRLHRQNLEKMKEDYNDKLKKLKVSAQNSLAKVEKEGKEKIAKKQSALQKKRINTNSSKQRVPKVKEDEDDRNEPDPIPVSTPTVSSKKNGARRPTKKGNDKTDDTSSSSDEDFIVSNLANAARANRRQVMQPVHQGNLRRAVRSEPKVKEVQADDGEVDDLFLDF